MTQKQITILEEFGRIETYNEDTVLFEQGDQHYDLMVVLKGSVLTDEKGFICTVPEMKEDQLSNCSIYQRRKPQSLETSIPRFFAVGDVRKGSVKGVASAVKEGSAAVSQVHQWLGELRAMESLKTAD